MSDAHCRAVTDYSPMFTRDAPTGASRAGTARHTAHCDAGTKHPYGRMRHQTERPLRNRGLERCPPGDARHSIERDRHTGPVKRGPHA